MKGQTQRKTQRKMKRMPNKADPNQHMSPITHRTFINAANCTLTLFERDDVEFASMVSTPWASSSYEVTAWAVEDPKSKGPVLWGDVHRETRTKAVDSADEAMAWLDEVNARHSVPLGVVPEGYELSGRRRDWNLRLLERASTNGIQDWKTYMVWVAGHLDIWVDWAATRVAAAYDLDVAACEHTPTMLARDFAEARSPFFTPSADYIDAMTPVTGAPIVNPNKM